MSSRSDFVSWLLISACLVVITLNMFDSFGPPWFRAEVDCPEPTVFMTIRDDMKATFDIQNIGARELAVKKVLANCGCISSTFAAANLPLVLSPRESVEISVVLDPGKVSLLKKDNQEFSAMCIVASDDPHQPMLPLTIRVVDPIETSQEAPE